MIAILLLGALALLAGVLALVAYSSNNRKRAGQSGRAAQATANPVERRSE